MATTDPRRRNLRERLNQAASVVRDQQRQITDLETRIAAQERQIGLLWEAVNGFGDLVKDQSRSIQRAAHANYRALDERIGRLEELAHKPEDVAEAELEAADAAADLPAEERQ